MSDLIVAGNLADDPKYTVKGDKHYLSIRIIENRRKRDDNSESGYTDSEPNVFNALLMGARAEMWRGVFRKGMSVLAHGSLAPNNSTSEDGTNYRGFSMFLTNIAVVPWNCTIQYQSKSGQQHQSNPQQMASQPQLGDGYHQNAPIPEDYNDAPL